MKELKKFKLYLSMGHDTDLRDVFYEIEAKDKHTALICAIDSFERSHDLRKYYKQKGLTYSPYHFFLD